MSSPWAPEREVTAEQARAAIEPLLGAATGDVRIMTSGWDNTVVRAGAEWIFRFPRRAVALPGVEREVRHLPALARRLPLPVPVPEHVGRSGVPPWPFWGARHLPGEELATSRVVDGRAVATAMADFLRTLHTIAPAEDLPLDPFGRADARGRAARSRPVLADLERHGLWAPDPAVEALLAAADDCPPPADEPVTSHGDLYARHVLVDGAGRPAAVIDWGDLCAAPRSVDLAFAFSALAPEHRDTFFAGYGPVDADTELRARVMALFSTASVAAYAHDVGDPALLGSALAALPLVVR